MVIFSHLSKHQAEYFKYIQFYVEYISIKIVLKTERISMNFLAKITPDRGSLSLLPPTSVSEFYPSHYPSPSIIPLAQTSTSTSQLSSFSQV